MGPAPAHDPPRDLTLPEAGSDTARSVLSRAIGRLLRELRPAVRGHAGGLDPADLEAFERVIASLRGDPAPLASVLRRPNVGVLVRALRGAPAAEGRAWAIELVALLCFELAALGALPGEIVLRRLPPRFVSLVARSAVHVPQGARAARFVPGRIVIEGPAGTIEINLRPGSATADPPSTIRAPYRAVEGEIVLALEDNNPLSMVEAHPDKLGNAIDLGGRLGGEWIGALRAALDLVHAHLPELRAEIDLYVQQIVPVGYDPEKHLSASYREAIGTVYMTLHPSPMTMVEALIHEFSHNKLNAFFEIDDVLENAFEPLYPSPVRPDPRPLHGVLLAVHAFVPVARLYERMIEARHPLASTPSFRERFAAIVEGNHEGAEVLLQHARPTPAGQGLFDELARWDRYFASTR